MTMWRKTRRHPAGEDKSTNVSTKQWVNETFKVTELQGNNKDQVEDISKGKKGGKEGETKETPNTDIVVWTGEKTIDKELREPREMVHPLTA